MGSTNWGRVSGKLLPRSCSKLQNSCPPFPIVVAVLFIITSHASPFPVVSLVQAFPRFCLSDPISHFRILFPCDRCGVRAFNYAFPRASADILVQISPTHGISNGNGNPSSIITRAVDAACGKECNAQRFSPGNTLPTASASFRRLSPFSRDAWSLQLAA